MNIMIIKNNEPRSTMQKSTLNKLLLIPLVLYNQINLFYFREHLKNFICSDSQQTIIINSGENCFSFYPDGAKGCKSSQIMTKKTLLLKFTSKKRDRVMLYHIIIIINLISSMSSY